MDTHAATTSSATRRTSLADDLRELYELLRGSPFANSIVEAEDAFEGSEFTRALQLVATVRRQYEPKHQRTLRQHEEEQATDSRKKTRPDTKLEARMEKIRRALELFAAITPSLQRLAEVQPAVEEPPEPRLEPSRSDAGNALPDELRSALAATSNAADQLAAIAAHCELVSVGSERDVLPGAYYCLQLKGKVHVVRTSATEPITDTVPIRHALTEQRLKPLAKQVFLQLGQNQQLQRIVPRTADEPESDEVATDPQAAMGLNMGDFSQLMDAAQRSGLLPNSDAIAHLRDREFRLGDYQKALQDMEALFGKFVATAGQREARLRREETDVKSGKLKLSARDLQQKRARDEAETQRIGRAWRRFQRVLEGLRMLAADQDGAE